MVPAPGIRIDGSLALDGWPVFSGLGLDLRAGQWTALLGPSGVGKSSLLRVAAGLIGPPDFAGTVTTTDGAPLAGRLAWMAQADLLLPWASVLENVLIGARLRGAPPARERALAALEAVGIAEKAAALPATLSGGQRQRAALARTLYEDAPVVLLDEPFSALDALTRTRLQDLAARLLAGRTVVMVTHEPLEAIRLADRLLVMGARGIAEGPSLAPRAPGAPRALADPAVLRLQADLLAALEGAE